MNFRDLKINRVYKSLGEKQLDNEFVNPVLNYTKLYKRGTAYFSSFVIESLLSGLEALYLNHGHVQLVISPQISKEDYEAIVKATNKTEEMGKYLDAQIDKVLFEISDNYFELFYQMLVCGFIEIKFAVTYTKGIYHDKLAIFEDEEGNKLSFSGSANETLSAYEQNYERVFVFNNWDESKCFHEENEKEFAELWDENNPELVVYNASQAIKEKIFTLVQNGVRHINRNPGEPKPRKYQQEAIDSWNGPFKRNGFFVMATGTGKTYTSCFCVRRVLEDDNPIIVILVPYIHLIAQWEESFLKVSKADYIIKMYSGNSPMWRHQLEHAVMRKRRNPDLRVLLISTIKSWATDYTSSLLNKYGMKKMLIVDEAHRFNNQINESTKNEYQYKIGLSATPLVGRRINSDLISFFGGIAYSLPIELAIEKGFLCGYYYHPIFVETTEEDEKVFRQISKEMASCFSSTGELKTGSEDKMQSLLRRRNRLLALAGPKTDYVFLKSIITKAVPFDNHFIVYCGDGKVNDSVRHLDYVKELFDVSGYKMDRFTCEESMDDRLKIIDVFNRNRIDGLVAIRCLDEGIDIPSIKTALLLSNGDNFREFVQRRGRILRHYDGKDFADIYDLVLLPSGETPGIAEIEFRRFYEYAKLSLNWENENKQTLERNIAEYGLDPDRIYNYFDNVNSIEEGDTLTDE